MNIMSIDKALSEYPEGTFLDIAKFNGNSFGVCSITGISPVWEMHPDTDEFFHILEGEFIIVLLENNGHVEYKAAAGTVFVVPKGIWHKPGAPSGAKFMYYTPGESLHSETEDPRNESA